MKAGKRHIGLPVYLVALSAFCLHENLAHAIMLDDFATPQHLSAGPAGPIPVNTGVTGNMIQGRRYIQITGTIPGLTSIRADVDSGVFTFAHTGSGQSLVGSVYPNLNHIDMTQGGTQDAFAVTVTQASFCGSLWVDVTSDTGTASRCRVPVSIGSSPVTYLFPFANFEINPWVSYPANLQDVRWISVNFQTNGNSNTGSIGIDDFRTVPEPATTLLILAGCLFVRRLRRKAQA